MTTMGPSVAGTWYPGDARRLTREVDRYLDVDGSDAGRVVALIEPHAGYVYSGKVAGHGFRAVRGSRFERVILIGPSHYESFNGAAVPDAEAYGTPLGEVELDGSALEAFARGPNVRVSSRPFGPEHSLEAEIPFLQRALEPGWKMLPVLVGPASCGRVAQDLADGLRSAVDETTLVVVSSDFTHYGPRFGFVPFSTDVPERIRELDMGAIDCLRTLDAESFEAYVGRTGATICGRHAIDVLLRLLPAELDVEVAAYDTSGALTGDWEHSVSYAAVRFTARAAA